MRVLVSALSIAAALVVTFGTCIEWPQRIDPPGPPAPVNLANLDTTQETYR